MANIKSKDLTPMPLDPNAALYFLMDVALTGLGYFVKSHPGRRFACPGLYGFRPVGAPRNTSPQGVAAIYFDVEFRPKGAASI